METYELLEKRLAEWCGRPDTVVVSSGTSALHLAIESFHFPLGSEIVIPEFCMIAIPRAVKMAGMVPVPVDCGDDLNIDPNLIEDKITHKTRAILAVHTYGRQCDMEAISNIAHHHLFHVIEDLAEAHGIAPHHATDAACWSFYRNKIIAGEEGGAIAFVGGPTDKGSLYANRARCLRSQGFTPDHDFKHIPRGVNARLSNANAQLILDSLDNFVSNRADRRKIALWYITNLPFTHYNSIPRPIYPASREDWVFDIRGSGFGALVPKLREWGIQARNGFWPISLQEEFKSPYLMTHLKALRAYEEVIYFPIDPRMTKYEVIHNCETFLQLVKDMK